MQTWFTADLHFFHERIIVLSKRSFRDIPEMHEHIINRWNQYIKPSDHVYLLGDISLGNKTKTKEVLDRLNGKIFLIRGNHDHDMLKVPCVNRFEWIKDYYYLNIQDTDAPDGKTQPIILCHYPFQTWNHCNYGAWHLHGHCHGNLPVDNTKKRHDVGIDNNCMRPINYDQVKEIMSERIFKPIDPNRLDQ